MSQNQTVFPGVGSEDGYSKNHRSRNGNYSHSRGSESNGTVFPGMGNGNERDNAFAQRTDRRQSSKPLVGFLYSISRTGFGEFWPIHIGPNTIGRSAKCDIILQEGTVSEEHAVIVVRMMKNPQKLDASISDERSSHGTMLNGKSISSTRPLECTNGDVLTIGECYQLYIVLIDAKSLGLSLADNFVAVTPTEEDDDAFDYEDNGFGQGRSRNAEDFPPRFNGGQQSYNQNPTNEGTVGMDGGNASRPHRGGTEW
ncbi:MAG: FHA domain-containing protein [Prevotellaceae bacterium]|jgi:hypothetical protein|nr:FHA domain-containing protein [Prevotellaceae bacterium]